MLTDRRFSICSVQLFFFFLRRLRPPESTRTDTRCPSTTLFRATGRFTGFRGSAVVAEAPSGGEQKAGGAIVDPAFGSLPLSDPQFGRRIDGALRGPLSRIIPTAETISGHFEGPIRPRAEGRRVGKGCLRPCRSRGAPES